MHKSALSAALLIATTCCSLSALAALTPIPQTGLWEIKQKTMINGRDLTDIIAKSQAANQDLNKMCITKQDQEAFTSPEKLLKTWEKDQLQGCKLSVSQSKSNGFSYSGQCSAANGAALDGTVKGDFTYHSATSASGTYLGKGTIPVEGKKMPYEIKVDMTLRRLQDDCGKLAH
jgi:Na+-translocating ferredoxin:NAD+ oxidoreductase RnfG subunit